MLHYFDEVLELGRRVNLNSLRLLSLALLFLSLTPLASLYVVFSSTMDFRNDDNEGIGDQALIDGSKVGTTNLLTVLRDPNATLEEILAVVLLERAHTFGGGSGPAPAMAYHWAAVIPWVLSMIFGFVIPILLYIMSCIRSRRLSQMRATDYTAYRRRRRRERMKSYLCNYTKTIAHEDCDTWSDSAIRDTKNTGPSWMLPKPGICCKGRKPSRFGLFHPKTSSSNQAACSGESRPVAGMCAICLNNYEPSQDVVWSSNPDCCHAFHSDCLLDWFSARSRKHYPCPCCRQVFFEKGK